MKKVLIALLLVLGMSACRQDEIWENPSSFVTDEGPSANVTKVEMTGWETVVHLEITHHPNYWIKVAKETVLRTDDGQEYAVKSGLKTDSTEIDMKIDALFRLPESGRVKFALHFRPLPAGTQRMHLIDDSGENGICLWNICQTPSSGHIEPRPDEWQDVQYDNGETLPLAKIDSGVATINVKMLDYQPGMNLWFRVSGFRPLGSDELYGRSFPFADDGTVKAEIPLRIAREVEICVPGMFHKLIIIAPNQETSILLRAANDPSAIIDFKGYMAKSNKDLVQLAEDQLNSFLKYGIMDSLELCETPEQRYNCIRMAFDKRIDDIQTMAHTPAVKELLSMAAEKEFLNWTESFGHRYVSSLRNQSTSRYGSMVWENLYRYGATLLPESACKPYTLRYLNAPTAPCYRYFWEMSFKAEKSADKRKNPLIWDMLRVDWYLNHGSTYVKREEIKDKQCRALIDQFVANRERVDDELKQQPGVYYKTYDDVAPKDIFSVILGSSKGKVVFICVWDTENAPCLEGHKALATIKESLANEDIQFVYITSSRSRPAKWQQMIADIPGEHYYLTGPQFDYLMKRYESEGIPTYVLYDKTGNRAFQCIGFHGIEPIRQAIEEALK